MDLMEIIGKAAAGEVLSEADRAKLADFRPGDTDAAALEKRNHELETRLEELEKTALSEPERLKRRFNDEMARLRESLELVGAERDAAKQELSQTNFRRSVEKIAREQGFSDADYLEYLCNRNRIDPASAETVEPFLKNLRESSPRFFKVDLAPGAPEVPPSPAAAERHGNDIVSLLAEVPAENE